MCCTLHLTCFWQVSCIIWGQSLAKNKNSKLKPSKQWLYSLPAVSGCVSRHGMPPVLGGAHAHPSRQSLAVTRPIRRHCPNSCAKTCDPWSDNAPTIQHHLTRPIGSPKTRACSEWLVTPKCSLVAWSVNLVFLHQLTMHVMLWHCIWKQEKVRWALLHQTLHHMSVWSQLHAVLILTR